MERLDEGLLARVCELLTARDILQLTLTCRAMSPHSPTVQLALERVLTQHYSDVAGFLISSESHWPRSLCVLRGVEMLRIKEVLSRSTALSFEDAALCSPSCVVVSRAWLGAWKKRCQSYEKFLLQFRRTKRQQRLQNAAKKKDRVSSTECLSVTRGTAELVEAGAMIVCPHGALLPTAHMCVMEQEARELEAEEKKRARFDGEIAGSDEMLELLQRKSGYPKGLFSPIDAGSSDNRQQLAPHLSVSGHSKYATYFLVPKKWLNKWRKFRTIVPPYISMFLSGFSLEQSLKVTQALGSTPARQYEIVTFGEWEALYDRYCAEFAVGFDVINGAYHWRTQECQVCNYGMGGGSSSNQPNSHR
ncbi:hypothetical protein JM18_000880 [Phytophthora kernoviae]|uniref:DUSP domain-containing protein n=2 Tax=Phytophthora kernoviae TaxID=325452 RepID=A0A8T0M6Y0_9STRA|nr:hypothetical protein G195_001653 [Phytophthora kernoviae 00238/432]KAG2530740.1 hypothetical protein JM16_001478 [Phytophthora kernoviae]KAG2532880.1 hypothetical protein JM18_000880 [Phytophthora kernoviae]